MSELPPAVDPLWARSQGALIDFIYADLDLAFTWLRTASIDVKDDPKGCELALSKTRAALSTARRFEKLITGTMAQREIHARADELEAALHSFRA
ncbi:MAG: hypothetical protein ABI833_15450 [Acidobacteriota bacterium]